MGSPIEKHRRYETTCHWMISFLLLFYVYERDLVYMKEGWLITSSLGFMGCLNEFEQNGCSWSLMNACWTKDRWRMVHETVNRRRATALWIGEILFALLFSLFFSMTHGLLTWSYLTAIGHTRAISSTNHCHPMSCLAVTFMLFHVSAACLRDAAVVQVSKPVWNSRH